MKWRPYWYQMSARQKKGCILLIAFGLVLMVTSDKLGGVGRFDWLEVASAHFGLTEGKFLFFFIIFTILCWIVAFTLVMHDRRKKNELKTRKEMDEWIV